MFGNDQNVIEDDDFFAPQSRSRSNTWPAKRPDNLSFRDPTSQDTIQEEWSCHATDYGSNQGIQGGNHSGLAMVHFGLPQGYVRDQPSPVDGKKPSTGRNPWGNMSYADLITQAILSSPDKRLTLSQIYEWMMTNLSYFRDKSDSSSSASWKVREYLYIHTTYLCKCI